MHGCARFFNAVRDTVTDKFLMTYKAGEPKPELAKSPTTEARGLRQPRRTAQREEPAKSAPRK